MRMKLEPDIKLTSIEKEKLLLKELAKMGAATANEVIDSIYIRDLKLSYGMPIRRGWRFYVHLNKHFDTLKKHNLIKHKAMKKNPKGKMEKVWILSTLSLNKYFPNVKRKKNIGELVKKSLNKIKTEFKKNQGK